MIYVFLGKDFIVLNKKVDDLVKKLNISNIIKYDYSESSIEEIINEVNYIDLFNEQKLIIVSNFSFKKLNEDDEKILSKYIENMNDNIIIFKCLEESLDERKSITKLLKSKCKVETLEKLDYKNLHSYVAKMFADENIKTNFYQIKKILDLCEYDTDYTLSEVEKLLIYKMGEHTLSDEDIDNVISKNNEKEMFTLIDSVLDKNIASSLESYNILISGNIDEVVIIDNLAKQFRLLMQIKMNYDKLSEVELVRTLGVKSYVIKKLYPYTSKYSCEEIANMLYKLSDMDIDIKVNGYDKNKLLESFFMTL